MPPTSGEARMTKAENYLGISLREVANAIDPLLSDMPTSLALASAVLDHLYAKRIRPASQTKHASACRAHAQCVRCGKPAWRNSSSLCQDHRLQENAYQRKRYLDAKSRIPK